MVLIGLLVMIIPVVLAGLTGWLVERFLPPMLAAVILLVGLAVAGWFAFQLWFSYVALMQTVIAAAAAGWLFRNKRRPYAVVALLIAISPHIFFVTRVADDYVIAFDNGYSLYSMNASERYVASPSWNDKTAMIPPNIRGIAWTESLVLARTKTWEQSARFPEELPSDFWILNTGIPAVSGPLTESEFFELRVQLGIPDDVRLIATEHFMWQPLYLWRDFR